MPNDAAEREQRGIGSPSKVGSLRGLVAELLARTASTRFVTAAALIEELSLAARHGHRHDAAAEDTHPHVLVVDEGCYFAYGRRRRERIQEAMAEAARKSEMRPR